MDFDEELVDDTVDSDWLDIQDDSSANLMQWSEYSDMEVSLNTSELYLSADESLNTSAMIRDIANEAIADYNDQANSIVVKYDRYNLYV